MKALPLICAASILNAGIPDANAADRPKKKSPAPTESRPADEARSVRKPLLYKEYDLENGLHVILHQNHSAPVISTYMLYKVGSKNERPDRTGFAHFFEHLMFEGSEHIPRGTIDKYISGAGGNLNASTSFDQTDYYFNLPAHQLKPGLVFQDTPYQWVPIGSFQYIDQANIQEFRDFHTTYYRPENATLVIAGDFQEADARGIISDYFASIPKGKQIDRPKFEWKLDVKGTSKDVVKKNTPLPAIVHAWRAPSETHADAYPLEMLAQILGKGRSSRLYQSLVEKKGLAMSAVPYCYLLENAGVFALSVTGQSGVTLEELDQVLKSEIAKVAAEGVTPDELQKARNAIEAQYAESGGTMHERAEAMAHYHMFYGDTSLVNTELERYLKVKREDLQRVAKTYLTETGRHTLRFPLPESK